MPIPAPLAGPVQPPFISTTTSLASTAPHSVPIICTSLTLAPSPPTLPQVPAVLLFALLVIAALFSGAQAQTAYGRRLHSTAGASNELPERRTQSAEGVVDRVQRMFKN